MAGNGIRFVVADRSHDAGIRALLREVSMDGDVSLSLQCEPSYSDAAALDGDEHHAIVAVDDGRVVCIGGVSVRQRYLNGEPRRVGYLGRLRLAQSHSGRFDILRRGYAEFHELQRSLNLAACFTSIAEDNHRARRFLERGGRGFPQYRAIGELVTLLIRVPVRKDLRPEPSRSWLKRHGLDLRSGGKPFRPWMTSLCQQQLPSLNFAPHWTADWFDRAVTENVIPDPAMQFLYRHTHPIGCVAMWDQRVLKQAVVAGYSSRLGKFRIGINRMNRLLRRGIDLPAAGEAIQLAFASHLAVPVTEPVGAEALIAALFCPARAAHANVLAIGFDARDPRLPSLRRRFRPYAYRTCLYTVHWPDAPASIVPDGRLLYPEIALL